MRVGFVGLGLMGSGFTERLVNQGHDVCGYDLIEAKVSAAKDKGVSPGNSPADVASRTEQIHVCVMTPADLEAVLFGDEGVATADSTATSQANKVLVDHSTTPVEITRDFAERLNKETGMAWIDAPVSGGPEAARNGTLAIMAGGSQQAIDQAMPVLQVLGNCTHMGDTGAGQVTKMVNQILVLNNYCVLAESLAMAEAGGVDPTKIPQALAQGHAGSNLLQHLYPRMIERDFTPAGYAFQILKDLHMVGDLATTLNVPTPISTRSRELFTQLNEMGHGELDGSAVFKLFEQGVNESI